MRPPSKVASVGSRCGCPSAVGVYVDVLSGIGKISTNGLRRDGNTYMNDAYGKAEVTLRINISAGVGEINLELGEQ